MRNLFLIFILFLSSCQKINIRDYLYPLCLGLEKNSNEYKLILQIVTPSSVSKIENESSKDSEYEIILVESTSNSLIGTFSNLNKITKDKITFNHLRSIIIQDDLLKETKFIDNLLSIYHILNLQSNIFLYAASNVKEILQASKILENTPYQNKINSKASYKFYDQITLLEFLSSLKSNKSSYIPLIYVDENISSLIDNKDLTKNKIILVSGAYYFYLDNMKYISEENLVGNQYLLNKSINLNLDELYLTSKGSKFTLKYQGHYIFDITLLECEINLNCSSMDYQKIIKEKIKKDITLTATYAYPQIDIYNLIIHNKLLNRHNLNYEIIINLKVSSITTF